MFDADAKRISCLGTKDKMQKNVKKGTKEMVLPFVPCIVICQSRMGSFVSFQSWKGSIHSLPFLSLPGSLLH